MTEITVIRYSSSNIISAKPNKIETALKAIRSNTTTWIDITGIDEKAVKSIGKKLDIHPLTTEDILTPKQRSKLDEYEKYFFIVMKSLTYENSLSRINMNILFGKNFVITIKTKNVDSIEKLKEKILGGSSKITKNKSDFLIYSIIDAVVDDYYNITDRLSEEVEITENHLLNQKSKKTLNEVYKEKRNLSLLWKSIRPAREIVSHLEKTDSKLMQKSTMIYLKDLYDHTIQIIENVEYVRERESNMIDIYLSGLSNKTNDIMKVLTIIATIFIPLTFVTGLYGMNFDFMPELGWALGYPAVLFLMLVVAVIMLIYFRRKGWL